MVRYILLAGTFINYFGVQIVLTFIDPPSYENDFKDARTIPYNEYSAETINELIFVFALLFILAHFIKIPSPRALEEKETIVDSSILLYILYYIFLIYYATTINSSFSNLTRGQGQFKVNALASFKSVSLLAIPYGFYALKTKLFNSKTIVMVVLLFAVIIMSEISSGDRRLIGYIGVGAIIYVIYFTKISIAKLSLYGIGFGSLLMLSIISRTAGFDNMVEKEEGSFFVSLAKNILLVNSDCAHLWWVKYYINHVTGYLGLGNFLNHFIFLLFPTFIIQLFTGNISYDRPVFLFNDLFNKSTNQGYDFMMTADFYWHFGFLGYFVYIFFLLLALKLFSKYIYSKSDVMSISSIFIVVYWIGGQRSDFGVFLRTTIYTAVFLYIVSVIRKIK